MSAWCLALCCITYLVTDISLRIFDLFNVAIFIYSCCHFHEHARCMFCWCRFYICRVSSTSWQLIQPWSCAGQKKYFVNRLILIFCCKFLPCIVWPLAAGKRPAGCFALCYQLDNMAFPRLWGSGVPTVPANQIHETPWTVIAESNPPLGLDALILATASPCLLLDVPGLHCHSFGNMTF
jgi:hypothetical protein